MVSITEWLIEEKNSYIDDLDRQPIHGSKVLLMSKKSSFGNCCQLSNGKWIYTNYNPQAIVKIIGNLCRHCGVNLDKVVITYMPKNEFDLCNERNITSSTETNIDINDDVKVAVISILEDHFPNGIRPNSTIDINKLKNFYREVIGKEISSEIKIPLLLNVIGIRHGDKIFVISSSGKKGLIELINHLVAEGHRVFYYDEFYDIHADYSAELLKTVLISFSPSLHYSRVYFSVTSSVSLESEVLRCYETAVCLSFEQLKEKLQYVPLDKIKQVLAQNSDYIWVKTGVYTHTSKLKIDEIEQQAIWRRIEEEMLIAGMFPLLTSTFWITLDLILKCRKLPSKTGCFRFVLLIVMKNAVTL